ncbi:two-component system histidine kinase PnpS [Clostridium frigidicarnis]|uniref:histidine kinase n=1 Tax=Clostridium frigidicarnis TaxID=84698 RepID=A0A1I0VNS3_9CLOT|nr:ATP-binding protein [Clostridium frigidicarnis]SFA77972.1 two-component system, OmpR family, phosphate regulon sensor histidine kinase PhoR [Clostridium frigidicarnis]
MRKKILILVISTIIFTLIVISSLFIVISNYQQITNTKQELSINNRIINRAIENKSINDINYVFDELYNKEDFRITWINKNGEVLYDSDVDSKIMGTHSDREEVKQAKESGNGSSIRYSGSLDKNMLYYATELSDGGIIRTAIALDNINILKSEFIKYYIIVFILVIFMAVMLSVRLSQIIVDPIKELEFVTSRIAGGDLNRRVKAYYGDEVGDLAKTFNNMTNKLQSTISEARDKQNRLEAILKSMDSGVVAVDRNSKIIMMNPYAKKIFGIKKNIIGENLMDNIRDFEFEKVFKENSDDFKELTILWPSEKDLRIRTAEIRTDTELIGTVAVVQDVTDIKKLENVRSEFVANVSHELKTPLTSIKGFAETLKYVDDDVNKERFLNIINDEAERLTRLIEDILILSHIEQHNDDVIEIIKVDEVLKDLYYLMKNTADKKDILLEFNLNSNVTLIGNKDRFKQMMINLIDNGIKYSDFKGKVKVISGKESNNCVIKIIDKGMGISEEHISRLFERFYRVDKARSRANGGTGLGLAIVKHIIITFEGKIDVKSEVGKGSEFKITLPIKKL